MTFVVRGLMMLTMLVLAGCSGGSAPDLSALDGSKSNAAFILATVEIEDFTCETNALDIGQKQPDGTYRRVTSVAIGTPWSAAGVQTSLEPGEYHIVGVTCVTTRNAMTVIPGRRDATAIPFQPIYKDSIAQVSLAQGEVVSIGAFRFKLGAGAAGPIAVLHSPLSPDLEIKAKQSLPKLEGRLVERKPTSVVAAVGGRCFTGNAPIDCAELGQARALCKAPPVVSNDVAVHALVGRLKAIMCT